MYKTNKRKKKINLKKAMFILVITTIIVVRISMGKFGEVVNRRNSAKVAIPVFSSTTIDLNNIYPEMETIPYELVVKNTKEALKSDVSLDYTIEIKSVGNVPLKIQLFRKENGINIGENLLNNGVTEDITLEVGEKTQTYQLEIEWDKSVPNYKSYEYSGETSYIQIRTNVVQKD